MRARSVSVRVVCAVFAAGVAAQAQYSAEFGGWPSGRSIAAGPRAGMDRPARNVFDQKPGPAVQPRTPGLATTVSYRQLSHAVPEKARKAYDKGAKAAQKQDWLAAISHLERAVETDPGFVEAINDLGAAFAKTRELERATELFERATKLDPRYAPGFYNLSLMYLVRQRLPEAERAARSAVDTNRGSNTSRMVLGMTLVLQEKFTEEAVTALRQASEEYPQAGLFLARALAGRGEVETARTEIERYLQSGDRSGEEVAQTWLKALNSQ